MGEASCNQLLLIDSAKYMLIKIILQLMLCLTTSTSVPPPLLFLRQTLHVAPPLLVVAMRTLDTRLKQEETPPMTSLPLWQGLS